MKIFKPFVMIIAGPAGTGKTTLLKMLCKQYNFEHISEDELTKEIFPDNYTNIEDYPDKLKVVTSQLFIRIKELFDSGKCVVVDRINLEMEFIEKIKKIFHKHLIMKIL